MYVKWMDNGRGRIWLSTLGLKAFVESHLPEGVSCRDIEFLGEKNQIFLSLVLSDTTLYLDKLSTSEDLTEHLEALGLDAVVSWKHVSDVEGEDGPGLTERPYFWGIIGAVMAALLKLGLKGALECLLVGAVFYGFAFFFRSDKGQHWTSRIARFFKEMMD
ncbi:MAG: hypothetical protein U9Q00_00070 [Synergistota bacterium]|nr:hypothetical protein [Synergistota bacterium]